LFQHTEASTEIGTITEVLPQGPRSLTTATVSKAAAADHKEESTTTKELKK